MEHLLLLYFKDKPALQKAYYKFRLVLLNIIVLSSICTGILVKNENIRSFSLGLAAGIVLIILGQNISSIRNADGHNNHLNG